MKRVALLLAIFSLSCIGAIQASCSANFTWSQTSANNLSFVNTSTGTSGSTIYSWSFGDGYYDYGNGTTHIYNIPGHYLVTLSINDSSSGTCSSTFSDSIVVTGTIICNMNGYVSTQSASCTTCANGIATATVYSGGTAPYAYSWNAGGNPTSQSNTGLIPGSYTVTVTDANSCVQTFTGVVASRDTNCMASFTKTQTAANTIQFTSNSHNVSSNTWYSWNYGDGTSNMYASMSAPSHVYSVPGIYTVCLDISDSSSGPGPFCSSHYCDTVRVTGSIICSLNVSVNATGTTCSTCHDGSANTTESGGTFPLTYSWSTGATTGSVSGLAAGTYTVCVTDANGCNTCQPFTIGLMHCNAYFTVMADTLNPGDYIANNYSFGTGPVNCYWNWGDGTRDSTASPSHTYPGPGLYDICLTIFDSTGCSSTFCDSIAASRLPGVLASHHTHINVINRMSATGIKEIQGLSAWSLYPNPSAGDATIRYSLNASAKITVQIYDLAGRVAYTENNIGQQDAGNHQLSLDLSALPSGTYFIRLNANAHSETKLLNLIH